MKSCKKKAEAVDLSQTDVPARPCFPYAGATKLLSRGPAEVYGVLLQSGKGGSNGWIRFQNASGSKGALWTAASNKKKPGKNCRPAHNSIQEENFGLVSLGIMLIVVIDARLDFCFSLLG